MIKRKGGSQVENLTPDHKSLESRGQMRSDWGVLYIIENIFLRLIKWCPLIVKTDLILEIYEHLKFWDNKNPNFGTPTWESRRKVTFGCSPYREAQNTL
jgi:hypothetical protein